MSDGATKNTETKSDPGASEPLKPGKFGFRLRLNRQKREFRVCMTRAAAGVGFAGVCGILVGIVATVRHVSKNGPQSAVAQVRDIRDVSENAPKASSAGKSGAKQNAGGKSTASAAAKPVPAPTTKPSSPVAVTTTKAPLVTTAAPSAKPAPVKSAPTKAVTVSTAAPISTAAPKSSDKRTVGHQYLVLGSYPSLDDAKEAVEKLKKDGVACTAEQSLPGWAKSGWYSVVTVKGYTTTHDRGYERQIARLESKGYEPHAYKWRLAETD
jgi:cytoskeletal protein RodZ